MRRPVRCWGRGGRHCSGRRRCACWKREITLRRTAGRGSAQAGDCRPSRSTYCRRSGRCGRRSQPSRSPRRHGLGLQKFILRRVSPCWRQRRCGPPSGPESALTSDWRPWRVSSPTSMPLSAGPFRVHRVRALMIGLTPQPRLGRLGASPRAKRIASARASSTRPATRCTFGFRGRANRESRFAPAVCVSQERSRRNRCDANHSNNFLMSRRTPSSPQVSTYLRALLAVPRGRIRAGLPLAASGTRPGGRCERCSSGSPTGPVES